MVICRIVLEPELVDLSPDKAPEVFGRAKLGSSCDPDQLVHRYGKEIALPLFKGKRFGGRTDTGFGYDWEVTEVREDDISGIKGVPPPPHPDGLPSGATRCRLDFREGVFPRHRIHLCLV